MKTSLELDRGLSAEVKGAACLMKEKPATILRMAIRAGLPIVISRHQEPRPEGYFADMYKHWPKERRELEEAFANEKTWP